MSKVQHQWNPVRIVIGAILNADFEMLPFDQPAVAVFLEIKEAGCSLNIGKSFRVLRLKQLKPLAAHRAELKIPD